MAVLKTGCRAVFDTFAGLIPCRVLSIVGPASYPTASTCHRVRFVITRTSGPYREGEVFERSALWVVPVEAVVRDSQRIRLYSVEGDVNET